MTAQTPSNTGSRAARHDVDSLVGDSAKLVEDARSLGRHAMESAGEALDGLRERGAAVLDKGKEKAGEFKEGFDELVAEHPAKSVLIAAGVGALIGFALGRVRR